jgi:metal-responsive CopG/Arc/MetJ family transcriptional regulator
MYVIMVSARSVQISLDEDLLARIDRHPKVKKSGRSEFIRIAVRLYLDLERRRAIDDAYARAYGEKGDEVYEEFAELLKGQSWPAE